MQLMTKELEKRFLEVGSQEFIQDQIVIAKFFNPTGIGNWYATEFNPEDKCFFGFVSLFGDECDEWGYFSLEELESFRGNLGLGIERDINCGEKPISEFNIKTI